MEVFQQMSFNLILAVLNPMSGEILSVLILMLVFIVMSALISGSEVAFFSINIKDKNELE